MYRVLFTVAFAGAFCASGWAQDDRPDMTGTWQLETAKSDIQFDRLAGLTMVISEKDGKININEDEKLADGKERKASYACTTDGKDCEVRGTGAKAAFWYNGPLLVRMQTEKKGEVRRYRMRLSSDAKEMTIEVSQIVPQTDKIDKLILQKQ